jgi:hypothetical protein
VPFREFDRPPFALGGWWLNRAQFHADAPGARSSATRSKPAPTRPRSANYQAATCSARCRRASGRRGRYPGRRQSVLWAWFRGGIAEAIRIIYKTTHNCAEGAGAAALAGLIKEREQLRGRRAAVILSGQNIDSDWLQIALAGGTPQISCPSERSRKSHFAKSMPRSWRHAQPRRGGALWSARTSTSFWSCRPPWW